MELQFVFTPPRCPYVVCPRYRDPRPAFYYRHGTYHPKCRAHPVPRFQCRTCGRTFSRQTFRMDYRDHRPDLNPRLFQLLASGIGLRQSARNLGLSLRCTELKFRKIAAHLRDLNLNMHRPLEGPATFQFDEFETYECRRNTRPLTVPVLIETGSRFIVWSESAPIRPRGKMNEARERAIAEDEARFGPRRDESRKALRNTLRKARPLVDGHEKVLLATDEKSSYPGLAAEAFGARRLVHEQTNSEIARMTWNPLFPINHTEAVMRDLMGRLRRESWLVSKKGRYLDLALQLFTAYRNYVRRRFNYDDQSPAQILGFVPRRMTEQELLSWRQDWRGRSIHPLARRAESHEDRARRTSMAA